jgi:hypothetical protein
VIFNYVQDFCNMIQGNTATRLIVRVYMLVFRKYKFFWSNNLVVRLTYLECCYALEKFFVHPKIIGSGIPILIQGIKLVEQV